MDKRISKTIVLVKDAIIGIDGIGSSADNKPIDEFHQRLLIQFRENLQKILVELEEGNITPKDKREEKMGYVIIDSWSSLKSTTTMGRLSEKIIAAERAYLEL